MKIKFLGLLLLGLFLTGCEDGVYSATLIFEGSHLFEAGTHLPGDVFIRAGSADFATGSRVNGSVYIVGGQFQLNGRVGGDVAVLDGEVNLGPEAAIGGDLRLGEGTVQGLETAVIEGEVVRSVVPVSTAEITSGWDDRLRLLVSALLLAVVGGLWAAKQPRLLVNVGRTAVDDWPAAAAAGLLVVLVLPILLVIMAFTIILLPLVAILAGLLALLLGYGLIALGSQLGGWLARLAGREVGRGWSTFGGTLLLWLLFQLPVIGEALFLGTAVLVSGVMLLTRLGLRRYQSAAVQEDEKLAAYGRPPSPESELG